jgi:c-di-GMP-binding flagellar brake protein YcgR
MSGSDVVVRNSGMIASNLALLAKEKTMISAALGGKNSILTSILEVDLKKNIVMIDTSPSEQLNQMCLKSGRVQFSSVFNGVKVAFTGEKITRVRHNGYDVFSMSLPSSLYWFDRRGAFRVRVPRLSPGFCKVAVPPPDEDAKADEIAIFKQLTDLIRQKLMAKIEQDLATERQNFQKSYLKMSPESRVKAKLEREQLEKEREENPVLPDENSVNVLELRMIDLSMTGCALMNNVQNYSHFLSVNRIYKNCVLELPDHGECTIDMEIMMQNELEENDDKTVDYSEFIGMKFLNLTQISESKIFRYIQAVDRYNKNKKPL